MTLYALLLDLRKAHDSAWRKGLQYKLLVTGIRGRLGRTLQAMLSGTRSWVRIGSAHSKYFDVTQGVGQGAPLRTHPFNVFINNLLVAREPAPGTG